MLFLGYSRRRIMLHVSPLTEFRTQQISTWILHKRRYILTEWIVRPDHDLRTHAPRLRQHVFCLIRHHQSRCTFSYPFHSSASELDNILIGYHDTVVYYRPQRHPSHHQHHPEQLDGISLPVCYLRNGHGGYHVCGCWEGARGCEAVCAG